MGLADRIHTAPKKRRSGLPCSVGDLLERLPDEDADALRHMLETGWSQTAIYDAVTGEGHDIGRQTINRHRSQSCSCFKVES